MNHKFQVMRVYISPTVQPLEKIVESLEKLGYRHFETSEGTPDYVETTNQGYYSIEAVDNDTVRTLYQLNKMVEDNDIKYN
jgi:anthranilate phosphoribosyltransferase